MPGNGDDGDASSGLWDEVRFESRRLTSSSIFFFLVLSVWEVIVYVAAKACFSGRCVEGGRLVSVTWRPSCFVLACGRRVVGSRVSRIVVPTHASFFGFVLVLPAVRA